MYCPHCGAADQSGRFCTKCGAALSAAPSSVQPAITNTVDVTVNVGSPVIHASKAGAKPTSVTAGGDQRGEDWYGQSAVIILALVLFFPLGLILMWTASSWKEDTKWAVSGLFLWPLWLRFIWRQSWKPGWKAASAVIVVLAYLLLLTGSELAGAAVLLVGLPGLIWTLRQANGGKEPKGSDVSAARDRVEADLEACYALIEEIEGTVALRLLPASSPIHGQYLQALELRKTADDMAERATSESDIAEAARKASGALAALSAVRSSIDEGSAHTGASQTS